MPSKQPKQRPQVALTRKAAALKAANAAKSAGSRSSRAQIEEQNLKSRVAADAYTKQLEDESQLLTKQQVVQRVRVSFPTIWKWMREGTFPRARVVGNKSVWFEREVNAWIAALPMRQLKSDEEVA